MSFADLMAAVDSTVIRVLGEPVPVTYTPNGGASVPVTGIFDEQFVLAKGSADAGVEVSIPAVFFKLADLPVDPEVDDPTLIIGGVSYRVRERVGAGMGGIVLGLRKIT
jgi:hypothetical protein